MSILAELERETPDVVHLFWGHYPSIVGYLVRKGLPDTVLSHFLGSYDLTRRFGGTAWVACRADVVFTHARVNVPAIERLGVDGDTIHVAYRGLDRTQFQRLSGPKMPRRIAAIGRLDKGKGMDDVLVSFRHVLSRYGDATLHILGQGPERRKLEALAQSLRIDNSVRFLGHVSHQCVAKELAAATILLHMSSDDDTERLPNVVKEGMASECVCIVSGTPGIDELVRDGENGFVIPKRDVVTAANLIMDVFGGVIDTRPLIASAVAGVMSRFDASESMKSYQRRWRVAIDRRRGIPVALRSTAVSAGM